MSVQEQKTQASFFRECFSFDRAECNPIPKGVLRKIIALVLTSRYSMPVLMRLSQLYYLKSSRANRVMRNVYSFLSALLRRINVICNNFEHGVNPQIGPGVVFHNTGVCITSNTVIESGVHIYRNVTFGIRNGGSPYINKGAKIASHSIVLGEVIIGEKAIVVPGAVVIKDVPAGKIAAGVPAVIIGDVTNDNNCF